MDKLTNRSRAFAEGVVVMVCPVLLALFLMNVGSKSEEHGPDFPFPPIVMLVTAGVTLVSGICPVLACCFSERVTTAGAIPPRVTRSLAPFSSTCLVVLACLVSLLIISKTRVITIGTMFGVCIVIRTACYARNDGSVQEAQEEFYYTLDNSHEFLSGVTGILFLGLEGLALEGQVSSSKGIQIEHRLRAPMDISFGACALGVFLMLLEMIPPLAVTTTNVAIFTVILDGFMAIGTVAVLVAIMLELLGRRALLLFAPAFLIFLELVLQIAVKNNTSSDEEFGDNSSASMSGNAAVSPATPSRNDDDVDRVKEPKPASLELTKVTFTGFLAVSVATVSSGSPNSCTGWFLLFAAAAIVCGLAWRLLTHAKSNTMVGAANVASFCTHFCVAVASILFAVMAGKALS